MLSHSRPSLGVLILGLKTPAEQRVPGWGLCVLVCAGGSETCWDFGPGVLSTVGKLVGESIMARSAMPPKVYPGHMCRGVKRAPGTC